MSNRIIELHDSDVEAITVEAHEKVCIKFSAAYLHESTAVPGVDRGSGYLQKAELIAEGGKVSDSLPQLPGVISDGFLLLDGRKIDNIIPVPFEFSGNFGIQLTFDTGETVSITGTDAKLILYGEPEYLEEFPGE